MNDTYEISTEMDSDIVFDIFEEKLIPYGFWDFGKFGYIGKVDRNKKMITIIDHMNTYLSRRGMRYFSQRKFVGIVERRNGLTYISGQFYMQPLYKISYILFFVLATLMILPFAIVSHDLHVWIKLLGVYIVVIGLGVFVVVYNLFRAEKYENDTVEFIRDILK